MASKGRNAVKKIRKKRFLNFDKNSGIIAGKISRQLKDNGEEVEFRDIFIGSICISNDVELFTLNVKHFERMKKFGLNLVKTN